MMQSDMLAAQNNVEAVSKVEPSAIHIVNYSANATQSPI